jgi:hypothetical protein
MIIDHAKIGNEIQLIKREDNNDYDMNGLNQHLSKKEQENFGDKIPQGYFKDDIIFKDA